MYVRVCVLEVVAIAGVNGDDVRLLYFANRDGFQPPKVSEERQACLLKSDLPAQ